MTKDISWADADDNENENENDNDDDDDDDDNSRRQQLIIPDFCVDLQNKIF